MAATRPSFDKTPVAASSPPRRSSSESPYWCTGYRSKDECIPCSELPTNVQYVSLTGINHDWAEQAEHDMVESKVYFWGPDDTVLEEEAVRQALQPFQGNIRVHTKSKPVVFEFEAPDRSTAAAMWHQCHFPLQNSNVVLKARKRPGYTIHEVTATHLVQVYDITNGKNDEVQDAAEVYYLLNTVSAQAVRVMGVNNPVSKSLEVHRVYRLAEDANGRRKNRMKLTLAYADAPAFLSRISLRFHDGPRLLACEFLPDSRNAEQTPATSLFSVTICAVAPTFTENNIKALIARLQQPPAPPESGSASAHAVKFANPPYSTSPARDKYNLHLHLENALAVVHLVMRVDPNLTAKVKLGAITYHMRGSVDSALKGAKIDQPMMKRLREMQAEPDKLWAETDKAAKASAAPPPAPALAPAAASVKEFEKLLIAHQAPIVSHLQVIDKSLNTAIEVVKDSSNSTRKRLDRLDATLEGVSENLKDNNTTLQQGLIALQQNVNTNFRASNAHLLELLRANRPALLEISRPARMETSRPALLEPNRFAHEDPTNKRKGVEDRPQSSEPINKSTKTSGAVVPYNHTANLSASEADVFVSQ